MATSAGPLAGVRVLDLTLWVQGPIAGTLLADLGADVIKIEKAGVGDHSRSLGTVYGVDLARDSFSLLWNVCNRNKRSLALDLHRPEGRPVFEALVREADVVVTNLMVEALEQLGASEPAIRELNPGVIYARAGGFGEVGPRSADPCQDTVGMAYAGLLFTVSADGETPYYPPGALSDVLSGTMLAFGVLAALRERDRTGEGQYVSTSQLQSLMWLQSLNVAAVANLGRPFLPSDRHAPPNPMFNTYPCGDGRWIAMGMPVPNLWPQMCEAIGRPDMATDPRYAHAASRSANARECVRDLDAWFATGPAERWLGPLRAAGIWVAPINRVEDLVDDEQVHANGLLRTLDDGTRVAQMPFTIRGHEARAAVSPGHGEHTDVVLGAAGFEEERVARLRASGAVW